MDRALYPVVIDAYVVSASPRKVDTLVALLNSQSEISKSHLNRINANIDLQVQALL